MEPQPTMEHSLVRELDHFMFSILDAVAVRVTCCSAAWGHTPTAVVMLKMQECYVQVSQHLILHSLATPGSI